MYCDFHNDVLTADNSKSLLSEYKRENNQIVCALFKGERDYKKVYQIATEFLKNKSPNLHLAFENVGFENIDQIKSLLALNPKYVSLTWNGQNSLGGGAGCESGLTNLGKRVVLECNRAGVAVDTAHLSKVCFYQVLNLADRVVNSHCCFDKINPHIRNITTEQIKLLINKGGLIGLCLYSPFISSRKSVSILNLFEHIDYFLQNFGDKNLCIGSDFNGCNQPVVSTYNQFSEIETVMKNNGCSSEQVKKITFQNLYNFINIC